MDEATDSNKEQVPGRATEGLFKIIDSYLKEANLKWEDCMGICTDGAQAMDGKRGRLQALIKHVSPQRPVDALHDTPQSTGI